MENSVLCEAVPCTGISAAPCPLCYTLQYLSLSCGYKEIIMSHTLPNVPWGQITSLEDCRSTSLIVVLRLWSSLERGHHLYHTLPSASLSLPSSIHQFLCLCRYYACISYGSLKADKAKPSYCSVVNLSSAFIAYLFTHRWCSHLWPGTTSHWSHPVENGFLNFPDPLEVVCKIMCVHVCLFVCPEMLWKVVTLKRNMFLITLPFQNLL